MTETKLTDKQEDTPSIVVVSHPPTDFMAIQEATVIRLERIINKLDLECKLTIEEVD